MKQKLKLLLIKLLNKTNRNLLVVKIKDTHTKPKIIYKGEEISFVQYMSLILDPNEIDRNYKFTIDYVKKQKNGRVITETKGFKSPYQ